jgi:TPR repeat protein
MNDLGWLSQNGEGTRQDYGEARRWFEKAAAGNPVAIYNLGLLYQSGKGREAGLWRGAAVVRKGGHRRRQSRGGQADEDELIGGENNRCANLL